MADVSVTVHYTTIAGISASGDPVDITSVPLAPWTVVGTISLDRGALTGVSYSINSGPARDATPSSGMTFTFNLQSTDIPCNGSYILAVYAYAADGTDIGAGLETRTIRHSGIIVPPVVPPPPPPGPTPPPPGPPFPVI